MIGLSSASGSRLDTGIGVAPSFHTAMTATNHSRLVGSTTATTSSRPTPKPAYARAIRLARRSRSRRVITSSSSTMAIRSGSCSANQLRAWPIGITERGLAAEGTGRPWLATAGDIDHRDAMGTRLVSVVVDANDLEHLSKWWASALGWRVTYEAADEVTLEPAEGSPGVEVTFVLVPEAKRGKNRVHLDLASSTAAEQAATVDRLVAAGAKHVVQAPAPWVVLADPEG